MNDYIKYLFDETEDTEDAAGKETEDKGADGNGTEKDEKAKAPTPRYTDEDIDRIIGQKFAKWQKQQEKAVSEAQKLAQMDEKQKAEYEKTQLEEELNALKAEKAKNELTTTARGIVQKAGINITDELLDILVRDDAEQTNAAVNSFIKLYNAAVQEGVKTALKGGTPKTSTSAKTLTKEDILKVKDDIERKRLIAQNIKLFQK